MTKPTQTTEDPWTGGNGQTKSTDDTERLNWLLEQILTRQFTHHLDLFQATGIQRRELTCPGDVTLGERVRWLIDQRIAESGTNDERTETDD